MKRFSVLLVAVVLICAIVLPTPVLAKDTGFDKDNGVRDALVLGAKHMLNLQGTFPGTLQGNSYTFENAWEWDIGGGVSYQNIQGISAMGLLSAWEKTYDKKYLNAAIAAGNSILKIYQTEIANGITWDNRPYSADIEFLCQLSKDSWKPVYFKTAVAWYKILTDIKTAEQNADRYIIARKSLSGWDLSSQIRAADATGNKAYARTMATEVIRRAAEWKTVLYDDGTDYTMLSYAGLLSALDEVRGLNQAINQAIKEYSQALLDGQGDDGSWDNGTCQTTAYAIIGLEAVKGRNSQKAQTAAGTFLVSAQADNGGWIEPDGVEYGEDNSECLTALGALITGGNHFGIFKNIINRNHNRSHGRFHFMK